VWVWLGCGWFMSSLRLKSPGATLDLQFRELPRRGLPSVFSWNGLVISVCAHVYAGACVCMCIEIRGWHYVSSSVALTLKCFQIFYGYKCFVCIYICICICIYIHVYTYIYTYIDTHIHTYIHIHTHIHIPHVWLVPVKARRWHCISLELELGWLWAILWVLGIELGSFTGALNRWAISPATLLHFEARCHLVGALWFGWTGWQRAGFTCLHLSSGMTHECYCTWPVCGCWAAELRSSCLCLCKCCTNWVTFPALLDDLLVSNVPTKNQKLWVKAEKLHHKFSKSSGNFSRLIWLSGDRSDSDLQDEVLTCENCMWSLCYGDAIHFWAKAFWVIFISIHSHPLPTSVWHNSLVTIK
jgi:hypothetical protein